jgi:hypothetical protein
MQSENTSRRSGVDRRDAVDQRNPGLQGWIRKFWNRYYKDNPEKNRRVKPERRKTTLFDRIRLLFSRNSS